MMTETAKQLYNSACLNKEFLKDIWEADGDEKPDIFATKQQDLIFISCYYGWLVGKFGTDWKQNL